MTIIESEIYTGLCHSEVTASYGTNVIVRVRDVLLCLNYQWVHVPACERGTVCSSLRFAHDILAAKAFIS